MGMTLQQFQEGLTVPIKKLSKKQLQEREDFWRSIWSWVDDEVKYYVYRIGQDVRVVLRNYRGSLGELGEVRFKLDELELAVYDKHFNEQDNKFYLERKILKVPDSAIIWKEFIQDRERVEEPEQPSLTPLPVEIEVE